MARYCMMSGCSQPAKYTCELEGLMTQGVKAVCQEHKAYLMASVPAPRPGEAPPAPEAVESDFKEIHYGPR